MSDLLLIREMLYPTELNARMFRSHHLIGVLGMFPIRVLACFIPRPPLLNMSANTSKYLKGDALIRLFYSQRFNP